MLSRPPRIPESIVFGERRPSSARSVPGRPTLCPAVRQPDDMGADRQRFLDHGRASPDPRHPRGADPPQRITPGEDPGRELGVPEPRGTRGRASPAVTSMTSPPAFKPDGPVQRLPGTPGRPLPPGPMGRDTPAHADRRPPIRRPVSPAIPPHRILELLDSLGVNTAVTPSGNLLWSPRLGFNYDVGGRGRAFLRGGVGLFAGRPIYLYFSNTFETYAPASRAEEAGRRARRSRSIQRCNPRAASRPRPWWTS